MSFVFTPPSIVGLPIADSDKLFPVRRVYCVGRNYAAHAREMGFDPDREPPFFFCKPNDDASVVPVAEGQTVGIPYPPLTSNYHYEAELVVAIGKGGKEFQRRGGFCLETQFFPNAPANPHFPQPELRMGEVWEAETVYKLDDV